MTRALKFHAFADIFPMMQGDPYAALVADIKANGLLHPIVVYGDTILDGRNRYKACDDAKVEPRFDEFAGGDPLAYVISVNLQRRHLNESQRAMVASKLSNLSHGQRPTRANLHLPTSITRPDAAALLHVSARAVADAKKVRDQGSAALVARVESGEVAVSLAAKIAAMPPEDQQRVATLKDGDLRGAVKRVSRSKREVDLADATEQASAALGYKLYGVIYADPPWQFDPYSRTSGMDRAADNHYPTMSTADISAIKPPAADDAALFLWATAPMLPHALTVMRAWGFEYKSHCIWDKGRIGTGYWFRNCHEVLLLGTRGSVPAPAPGEQFKSLIVAPLGAHSVKPAAFAEMIEEMFPTQALLEMFAREPRAGWDAWGNELRKNAPKQRQAAMSQ